MRRSSRCGLAALALFAVLVSPHAGADVVLSSEKLNAALKQMQRLQVDRRSTAETAAADTVFALGEEARALAELMSREVAAHGRQQQPLLDLALGRASALGVDIAWSADHERYFYDGDAYRRYLEVAPEGPHAEASMFRILWNDFYHAAADDHAVLVAQAAYKEEFLRRFPGSKNAAEAGLFLAIDYRDLWRDCVDGKSQACDGRYAALAREQFQRVATEHGGTDQAKIASRLLRRFDAEAATR
ncbi:MAG TPA: hypothetical protein VFG91_07790 [Woeseiaceae bacterium]|nr:hypothetical protein [Woeseiaceae bacterium]